MLLNRLESGSDCPPKQNIGKNLCMMKAGYGLTFDFFETQYAKSLLLHWHYILRLNLRGI